MRSISILFIWILLIIATEVHSQDLNSTFKNDYYRFDYPSTWQAEETEDFGGGVLLFAFSENHPLQVFVQNPFRLRMENPSLLDALNATVPEITEIEEVIAGNYEAVSYYASTSIYGELIGILLVDEEEYFVNIMLVADDASSIEINQYHEVLLEIATSYELNNITIDEITVIYDRIFHLGNPTGDYEFVIQELLSMGLIQEEGELLLQVDEITVEAGEITVFDSTDYRRNIVMSATIDLEGSGSCGLLSHIQLKREDVPEDYLQIALSDNIIWHPQQQPDAEMTLLLEHTVLGAPMSFGLALPEKSSYHLLGIIDNDVITFLINGYVIVQDPYVLIWDYEAGAYGFGLIDTRDAYSDEPHSAEGYCTANNVWFYALDE